MRGPRAVGALEGTPLYFYFLGIAIREERGPRGVSALLFDFGGRGRQASAVRPMGPMGEINIIGNSPRRGRQGRASCRSDGSFRKNRFARGGKINQRALAERKRERVCGMIPVESLGLRAS